MSIILDALRKAELERTHRETGLLAAPPDLRTTHSHRNWAVWAAIGLTCLILGGFLTLEFSAWFRSHRGSSAPPSIHSVHSMHTARETAPQAASGSPTLHALQARYTRSPAIPKSTSSTSHHVAQSTATVNPGPPPAHLHWQIQVFSWSPSPERRFVVINMHTYRTGAVLPGGARLVRILRQGLLIRDGGRLYLFPHP